MLTLKGNFLSSHQINIGERIKAITPEISARDISTIPETENSIPGYLTAIWAKIKNMFDGHLNEANAAKHLGGLVRARYEHQHTAPAEQTMCQLDALEHFNAMRELASNASKGNFTKEFYPESKKITLKLIADDPAETVFEFTFTPTSEYLQQDADIGNHLKDQIKSSFAPDKLAEAQKVYLKMCEPGRTLEQDIASLASLKKLALKNSRDQFQINTSPIKPEDGNVSISLEIGNITLRSELCSQQQLAKYLFKTGEKSDVENLFEAFSQMPDFNITLEGAEQRGKINMSLKLGELEILAVNKLDPRELLQTISQFQVNPKKIEDGSIATEPLQEEAQAQHTEKHKLVRDYLKNYGKFFERVDGAILNRYAVTDLLERQVDLSYMDLSNLDLSNVDLSNAKLRFSDLSNSNLTNSDASKADLYGVTCTGTQTKNMNLAGTILPTLKFADQDHSQEEMSVIKIFEQRIGTFVNTKQNKNGAAGAQISVDLPREKNRLSNFIYDSAQNGYISVTTVPNDPKQPTLEENMRNFLVQQNFKALPAQMSGAVYDAGFVLLSAEFGMTVDINNHLQAHYHIIEPLKDSRAVDVSFCYFDPATERAFTVSGKYTFDNDCINSLGSEAYLDKTFERDGVENFEVFNIVLQKVPLTVELPI